MPIHSFDKSESHSQLSFFQMLVLFQGAIVLYSESKLLTEKIRSVKQTNPIVGNEEI